MVVASRTSRPLCSGTMRQSSATAKHMFLCICRNFYGQPLGVFAEDTSFCPSILPFSEIWRAVSQTRPWPNPAY